MMNALYIDPPSNSNDSFSAGSRRAILIEIARVVGEQKVEKNRLQWLDNSYQAEIIDKDDYLARRGSALSRLAELDRLVEDKREALKLFDGE
jgi:hypothetical protein